MAKKTAGPKEQQLRELREQQTGETAFDASSILAKIEEFKRQQVQPIREELLKLKTQRNEVEAQIDKLEKLLASLEGRTLSTTGGTRKPKRTPEQLKQTAETLFSIIKSKGKDGAVAADFAGHDYGASVTAFLEKYGLKIRGDGPRTNRRYFVA